MEVGARAYVYNSKGEGRAEGPREMVWTYVGTGVDVRAYEDVDKGEDCDKAKTQVCGEVKASGICPCLARVRGWWYNKDVKGYGGGSRRICAQ